jgi:hypothetical protein
LFLLENKAGKTEKGTAKFTSAAAMWKIMPEDERLKYKLEAQEKNSLRKEKLLALLPGAAQKRKANKKNAFGLTDAEKTPEADAFGLTETEKTPEAENAFGLTDATSDSVMVDVQTLSIGDFEVRIDAQSEIGKGAFGTVLVGRHVGTTLKVAAKVFFNDHWDERHDARHEFGVLQNMKSKCGEFALVPSVYVMRDSPTLSSVVMELYETNLQTVVTKILLSDEEKDAMIAKIAAGLRQMHVCAHMVHMDLKPCNVLHRFFDGKTVLADFSQTEVIGAKKPRFDKYTTFFARAPELWLAAGKPQCLTTCLAPTADYWSLGCLVWAVAVNTGEQLFNSREEGRCGVQVASWYEEFNTLAKVGHGVPWRGVLFAGSAFMGPHRVRARKAGRYEKMILALCSSTTHRRAKQRACCIDPVFAVRLT